MQAPDADDLDDDDEEEGGHNTAGWVIPQHGYASATTTTQRSSNNASEQQAGQLFTFASEKAGMDNTALSKERQTQIILDASRGSKYVHFTCFCACVSLRGSVLTPSISHTQVHGQGRRR